MRYPTLRGPGWSRRALGVTGRVSLAAGVVLLVAGWHQATPAVRHSPYARAAPTVVTGPNMYIPGTTNSHYAKPSTVTVSQTTNLVNQLVRVSWSNFTPSDTNGYTYYQFNNGGGVTRYAVLIAECKGLTPVWDNNSCYESDTGGYPQTAGQDGTPNAAYGITGAGTAQAGGSGSVNVDIETSLENAVLGCDQTHPCSLVIIPADGGVPALGGTPANCNDHANDITVGFGQIGYASPAYSFSSATGTCAWADRIVVPLHFAPVPSGCPQRTAAFSAGGSPMMAVAMQQWLTGLCSGSNGMTVSYNSTIAEPQAVQELTSGALDVALTTRPLGMDGVTAGTQTYLYAPISISAVDVAYWIDSNITGVQQSGLQLNPRILAKLLTTSYNPSIACTPKHPTNCDTGISATNPFDLLADPEFQALNPTIAAGINTLTSQTFIVPTVQSGASDMTWTMTRWLAADPAASAFLNGSSTGGTVVNNYYKGLQWPADTFSTQDPNFPWVDDYEPVFPLSQAVTDQAVNQDAGSITPNTNPQGGQFVRNPPQPVGNRALVAVLDEGDAALNQFPVAAIRNAAGQYVTPTSTSMAAAVAHMVSDGTGTTTEQVNLADKTPTAYPLTMVVYAMVPASGMAHTTATAVAKFLDFAAGAGQTPGTSPGQLPAGYLPLTSSMKAATLKIAATVAKETSATTPGGGNTTPPAGGTTPSSGTGLGNTASPAPTPSLSLPAVRPGAGQPGQPVSLTAAHQLPAAFTRFVLPALLILGGLAALGGSAVLAGAGEGGVLGGLHRLGKATSSWGQAARNLPGQVRAVRSRLPMERFARRGKD
ncbi:MAG TPA: hypothetical protein VGS19_25000 [Streptosporangiaceae bacterium]|nr:hypothetical protein [Streptosporangiaceae bacterium]